MTRYWACAFLPKTLRNWQYELTLIIPGRSSSLYHQSLGAAGNNWKTNNVLITTAPIATREATNSQTVLSFLFFFFSLYFYSSVRRTVAI